MPIIAIPTILLWLAAALLAVINPGTIAGVSHHTYTGWLFAVAVIGTAVLIWQGNRADKNERQ